ncbi:MAG: hydroxyisourate hydrolase [Rhodospirillales bacterium]|nr:hydroxyisourate hydrolase [Rhodospirillales bacterium]
MSDVNGRLTTHVLDTTSGRPAQGVRIELRRTDSQDDSLLAEAITNADGRCDAALLEGDTFAIGSYELLFHAGDYLRAQGITLPTPAFLEVVPIRFGISDTDAHIHVPLLISPYAYSTYRGS